jgi:hypothetical protein
LLCRDGYQLVDLASSRQVWDQSKRGGIIAKYEHGKKVEFASFALDSPKLFLEKL